eukprot:gene1499-806_t
METKINKIIQWYAEEGQNLPITCLATHIHSKVTGTLRTQFKAALLPTGLNTGDKRGRDEDAGPPEGDEHTAEEHQQNRRMGQSAPRKIHTLNALQQEVNRAIATRTNFDQVAHVNRSWLYSPPPIGLGVPNYQKEQAVAYLTQLTQMNSADTRSWDPAWGSIKQVFDALEDIDATLRNLHLWAQEVDRQEVKWEKHLLTTGSRRRYDTNILDMVEWLPHTRRRRGVAHPQEAGYAPEEAHMWHLDAGKVKDGTGVQTCIVTGVDHLSDEQLQVWTCPNKATTNEGEIIHIAAVLRSIAEGEEDGALDEDALHIITVDSGSALAGWRAACDERDSQVQDRQLSPYAIELRAWERRIRGRVVVCKQAEKLHADAKPVPCATNHRYGKALVEQMHHQHVAEWAKSPSGILARIATQQSKITETGKIVSQGLARNISACENERMTATQTGATQKAAAGRFLDMATWARARRSRVKNFDDR